MVQVLSIFSAKPLGHISFELHRKHYVQMIVNTLFRTQRLKVK